MSIIYHSEWLTHWFPKENKNLSFERKNKSNLHVERSFQSLFGFSLEL